MTGSGSAWRSWVGALVVTAALVALVALDLLDAPVNHWFVEHALTTSAITGVLVLAVTVLIVDRVLERRQLRDRADAIAAQAGLVDHQAQRAADTVRDAITNDGDRDTASDAIQTFLSMLMVSAPMLIGATAPRRFLEESDRLAALLGRAMTETDGGKSLSDDMQSRIVDANRRVHDAAQPLLDVLDLPDRTAVQDSGDDA